ncbi:hypothetical protein M513_12149 [Trichuris suis]|uniref:Uncharacterized protein n=1 Tax=Trichuris suis TaxID=68888 RepID=A0A085LPR3_9BILA|nr:hypothetical protein M513_12149 [Trichuris suis]
MERALAASAIAEHAAHCSGSLQGRVLCKESHLPLRRIKEALFIRHNTNINRDNGVDISAIWGNIINATKCCLIQKLTNQNCSKIGQSASRQLDQPAPVITSCANQPFRLLRTRKVRCLLWDAFSQLYVLCLCYFTEIVDNGLVCNRSQRRTGCSESSDSYTQLYVIKAALPPQVFCCSFGPTIVRYRPLWSAENYH